MAQQLPRLCSARAPHSMPTSADSAAHPGHSRRFSPTQGATSLPAEYSRPATVLLGRARKQHWCRGVWVTCRACQGGRDVCKAVLLRRVPQHLLDLLPAVLGDLLYPHVGGHRRQVEAVKGAAKVVEVRRPVVRVRWRLRVLAGGRIFTCRHRTESFQSTAHDVSPHRHMQQDTAVHAALMGQLGAGACHTPARPGPPGRRGSRPPSPSRFRNCVLSCSSSGW